MKYHLISRSDDLKIVGYYPQTEFRKGYNPKGDGCFNVKTNEFPDFVPNLELQLHTKSIPTDYLYVINLPLGMIVSKKMKEVFEEHKLPRHHFYKTKVFHKSDILDYFWLHFIVDDFWNFIDKNNSYGEVKTMIDPVTYQVMKKVQVFSRDQIIQENYNQKGTDILTLGKITMKKEFPDYDLYRTDCLGYHTLISKHLKQAILKEELTGMEIKPFDKFEVQS